MADLRYAIYEAARACDWDALESLLDPATFSYSFGQSGHPLACWQRAEFLHYQPMLYIADLLQRPFGAIETDGTTTYTWPSAQAYGSWAEVPEAERAALRPLYDEAALARFEDYGAYLGYCVGISWDAESAQWIYAVAGD